MSIKGIEPLNMSLEQYISYSDKKVEVRCPICKKQEWENVEQYVHEGYSYQKPAVCKECGFITYNPQCKDIKKFYEREVRPQSKAFLETKYNKLDKHQRLIMKYLDENGISSFSVLDYGSSDGYLLKALKDEFDVSHEYGIELNRGHANWGKYVDGLNITTDDNLKGYSNIDLICCYHVLEHVQKPDILLNEFRNILNDNGLLYLAVPRLDVMEYGTRMECYKEDHINLFTMATLTSLLESNGFEVVFEDNIEYGYTVICKKCEPRPYEKNYGDSIDLLKRLHKSFSALEQSKLLLSKGGFREAKTILKEALNECKFFPNLLVYYASLHDAIDEIDIVEEFIEDNPEFWPMKRHLVSLYIKDSDFESAIETIDWLENKTGETIYTINLRSQVYAYQGKLVDAIKELVKLYEKNPRDSGVVLALSQYIAKV